jgi:hypothetical protein
MYMSEYVNDIGKEEDPASFKDVMMSENWQKLLEGWEDELSSMSSNDI